MGTSTRSLKQLGSDVPEAAEDEIASLTHAIRDTRGNLGTTLEELHGALNPAVFKEEVMKQFQEARAGIKKELSEDLQHAKEAIKASVVQTTESLKEGIEGTRESLTHSVEAQISDAQRAIRAATVGKVETMVERIQDTAKETGRTFASAISENPVPFALVGLGVGWLVMSSMRKTPLIPRGAIGHAVDTAKHAAVGVGSDIKEAVSGLRGATGQLADGAGAIVSATQEKLASVAHEGGRLKDWTGEAYESHPWAFGAAALAVGALAGWSIPMSTWEREHVSGARALLVEKVEALAHQALEKVDEVAEGLAAPHGSTAGEGDEGAPDSGEAATERDGRKHPASVSSSMGARPQTLVGGFQGTPPVRGDEEPREERYGFDDSSPWPSRT